MGIASAPADGGSQTPTSSVSNSRRQTNAAYRGGIGSFSYIGSTFTRALGGTFTGWGDSWVDLKNSGDLELVLASGAIPVTNLAKNAGPIHVLTPVDDGYVPVSVLQELRTNGRGVAAADYERNDGRVDVAVNTIGGKLLLLHNTTPATGNWLTVDVRPFSPVAVVTAIGQHGDAGARGDGRSSYYPPRIRACTSASDRQAVRLTVRWPTATVKRFTPPTNAIFVAKR